MSANWWVDGGSLVAVIMIFLTQRRGGLAGWDVRLVIFDRRGRGGLAGWDARLVIFDRRGRGDLFGDFGYLGGGMIDGGDDRIGGNLSVRNQDIWLDAEEHY